jgi:DNA-binding NtrC family response regulator/tetratricopeptide (TPR) repeat protein
MATVEDLVGGSAAIRQIRERIAEIVRRLSRPSDDRPAPPVLILGETGTGKGLVARIIHDLGPRAKNSFVHQNCAALPETLIESELFGYQAGAFTMDRARDKPGLFEVAHRGTLFLDELGAMPGHQQARLLTAIDDAEVRRLGGTRPQKVDVHVIAATNDERGLRQDLLHRVSKITLTLPPLRERREDIIPLADYFLARARSESGLPARRLTASAEKALLAYPWPGNVRELMNVLERLAWLAGNGDITEEMLALPSPSNPGTTRREEGPRAPHDRASERAQRDLTRAAIAAALEAAEWRLDRAAKRLDVPRNTLRRYAERFGLWPPAAGSEAWEPRWLAIMCVSLEGPPLMTYPLVRDDLVTRLEAFGATVLESDPDGAVDEHPMEIVAAFGLDPVEDPPASAATAALASRRALDRVLDSRARQLRMTTAIDAMECAVLRNRDKPRIRVANLRKIWSRLDVLLEHAPAGAVVASPDAARFLRRRFALDPVAGSSGDADTVFRVLGYTGSGFRVGGRRASPFVGRSRALDSLNALFARAADGNGCSVRIVGEAGLGKSRLLHEFFEQLDPGRVWYLGGRCSPHGRAVPYLPILEVVRSAFGVSESDTSADVASKIRNELAVLGVEPDRTRFLVHLLGLKEDGALQRENPDAIKRHTLDTLERVLVAAAADRTVVIALEDLHWADDTSLSFISTLMARLRGQRILVLTTARPRFEPTQVRGVDETEVTLEPLTRSESSAIVHAIGSPQIDDQGVADILERGAGNPLHLEELTMFAADPGPNRVIPPTLGAAILARFERLDAESKHLLRAAAVVGKDFAVTVLASMLDEADLDSMARALQSLCGGEFLQTVAAAPSSAAYTFKHVLTHEVVYRTIPESQRRDLHARSAAVIARHSPGVPPEVLAHHYAEAGRHDAAAEYSSHAGRLAVRRSANTEAVIHFRNALGAVMRALPDTPSRWLKELELQMALSVPVVALHGYGAPEVRQIVMRARALCDRIGPTPHLFPALFALWRHFLVRADHDQTARLVGELLRVGRATSNDRIWCRATTAAGVTAYYAGELTNAKTHLEASAVAGASGRMDDELADTEDAGTVGRCFLAATHAFLGFRDRADQQARQGLVQARQLNHPPTLAFCLGVVTTVYKLRSEVIRVEECSREQLMVADEHELPWWRAGAIFNLAWAQVRKGNVRDGITAMEQVFELDRKLGADVLAPLSLAQLAEAYGLVGDVDRALALVEQAMEFATQPGAGLYLADLYRIRAQLTLKRWPADRSRSIQDLERALASARERSMTVVELGAAIDLAPLLAEVGEQPRAREVLRRVCAGLAEGLDLPDVAQARRLMAELA